MTVSLSDITRAVESSYDGIWITDAIGNTLFINEAICRITRLKRKNVVGLNMRTLVDRGMFDVSATLLALEKQDVVTILQHVSTGVETIVTATPVFNTDGTIDKVISNVRDITELSALKEKLKRAEARNLAYQNEIARLKSRLDEDGKLIAEDRTMQAVMRQAERIAAFETPVLLHGGPGSGRHRLARWIHDHSERRHQPFIKLGCGALPEERLERELFGSEETDDTQGAARVRPGLLELARGGTLYLEDIAALPVAIQMKLANAFACGVHYRHGGNKPVELDVRVLSSSTDDLEQQRRHGRIRDDLYYHVNVYRIDIPPLRQRRKDIPLLARQFLDQLAKRYGRKIGISTALLAKLRDAPWNGNIRELRNTMERLYVNSEGPTIVSGLSPAEGAPHAAEGTPEEASLKRILEDTERRVLQQAYSRYETTYGVANALGISQTSAVRKARKYAIKVRQPGRPGLV